MSKILNAILDAMLPGQPLEMSEEYSHFPILPGYEVEHHDCVYHVLATFPSRTGMKLVCVSVYNKRCENAFQIMNASSVEVVRDSVFGVGGLVLSTNSLVGDKEYLSPLIITASFRDADTEELSELHLRNLISGEELVAGVADLEDIVAIDDPFLMPRYPTGYSFAMEAEIPDSGAEMSRVVRAVKTFWGLDGIERTVIMDAVHPTDPKLDGFNVIRAVNA